MVWLGLLDSAWLGSLGLIFVFVFVFVFLCLRLDSLGVEREVGGGARWRVPGYIML